MCYAQSQGALKISDSGKPWAPFHLWTFTLNRYQQYLHDLREVHHTLEKTLERTIAAAAVAVAASTSAATVAAAGTDQAAAQGGSSSSSSSTGGIATSDSGTLGPVAALRHFGPELQLQRAAAVQQDLQALQDSASTATETATAVQEGTSSQAVEVPGGEALTTTSSSSSSRHSSTKKDQEMRPTSTAVAYAKYIAQLGKEAVAAAAEGDVASRDQALLRLVANAYSVHVVHQAFGIRVGASATEKLELFQKGAVALYKDYPEDVGDAQQRFMSAVDSAGRCLAAYEVEMVLQELPKAYTKNALLMGTLAQH